MHAPARWHKGLAFWDLVMAVVRDLRVGMRATCI
jgi:hypothetical protein